MTTAALEVHRNGSGRRERTVHCAETALLDDHTTVEGNASIWGRITVERSEISGDVKVAGATRILDSRLIGRIWITDNAFLVRCQIAAFTGEVEIHDSARLEGCTIAANDGCRVSIGENAKVRNVTINGEAYIAGDCVVENCTLEPGVRITRGYWNRSPRVIRTPWFDVCEDIDDCLFIGCESRQRELWLRSGVKIGLERGYSEAEVREYERIIKNW